MKNVYSNGRTNCFSTFPHCQTAAHMLASFMGGAHEQSLFIATLRMALQDTEHWDPATCPQPYSSSITSLGPFWTEVVVSGRKNPSRNSVSPLQFCISNRFEPLSHSGIILAMTLSGIPSLVARLLQTPQLPLHCRRLLALGRSIGSWAGPVCRRISSA